MRTLSRQELNRARYWPFALATRDAASAGSGRCAPTAREMAAAARRLRAALDGSMSRNEIEALLGKDVARGAGLRIHLVRVPP